MKKLFRKEEGFTIIEVVLVLAIAGLIFLVVFLALPQLQKSRRDTQRRSDASRIAAAMEAYASNSNGKYPLSGTPGDMQNFYDTYLKDQNFLDPSTGYQYGYGTIPSKTNTTFTGTPKIGADTVAIISTGEGGGWLYYNEAECTDNGATASDSGATRSIAIRMQLEQGVYCVDNQ